MNKQYLTPAQINYSLANLRQITFDRNRHLSKWMQEKCATRYSPMTRQSKITVTSIIYNYSVNP